jgi:hypothetical protein
MPFAIGRSVAARSQAAMPFLPLSSRDPRVLGIAATANPLRDAREVKGSGILRPESLRLNTGVGCLYIRKRDSLSGNHCSPRYWSGGVDSTEEYKSRANLLQKLAFL